MIQIKRTVDATVEPVELRDLKEQLRITHNDQDALLLRCLQAGRSWVETVTNRALMTQTWSISFDGWPLKPFYLPSPPFVAITAFTYRDAGGDSQPFTAYSVDSTGDLARVRFNPDAELPTLDENSMGAVTVTFTAGAATRAEVAPAIGYAILLLAASFYENPSEVTQGAALNRTPFGVDALLSPFTVFYHTFEK